MKQKQMISLRMVWVMGQVLSAALSGYCLLSRLYLFGRSTERSILLRTTSLYDVCCMLLLLLLLLLLTHFMLGRLVGCLFMARRLGCDVPSPRCWLEWTGLD